MKCEANVTDTGPSISMIIPVFNEDANIDPLFQQIKASMHQVHPSFWEVLFVNDGSGDRTEVVLEALVHRESRVRTLHFTSNQGQTAAMDAGIRHARGDILITMDGDLQNDPADIPRMLTHLKDHVDCVCGVRIKRNDTWVRHLSSRIANTVRNKISHDTITDTGCSLKLFRRSCFDAITLYEGMHRFLPTLVKMEGYNVVEVPVNHRKRLAGASKYGIWNRLFKSSMDLWAVRWMKKRKLRYRLRK